MPVVKTNKRRRTFLASLGAMATLVLTGGLYSLWKIRGNQSMNKKQVLKKLSVVEEHWVGDGFFVSTIFHPMRQLVDLTSPFLLMDHAAPKHFEPHTQRRGVGEHPHRGFETVTLAYEGEIDHRDSAGGGGRISKGGAQWMTAASGVVHEEMHSQEFTKKGGTFEMVQIWVNLPKNKKMTHPRYQSMNDDSFPRLDLGSGAVARIIAGEVHGTKGPAKTHSDVKMFDVDLTAHGKISLRLPSGTNTLVFVLKGSVKIGEQVFKSRDLAVMSQDGDSFEIENTIAAAKIIVLNGTPLNEPVVSHGPFVMNTTEEIQQAIEDYQNGKMGQLPSEDVG